MQTQKVILVTGASTGLGLAASILLAKNSHIVYASMRNLEKRGEIDKAAQEAGLDANNLRVIQLDVTDNGSVTAAIDQIVEKEGRIDVLINNAGYSLAGAVDDLSIEEAISLFDTNLFGVARTVKAVLPHYRKQKSGQIINVASVGGLVGFPFQEYYCGTKFALEGYTECLAISNAKLNIKVSLVEPGAITSSFLQNATVRTNFADEGVKDLFRQFEETMKASFGSSGSQTPAEVAVVIKEVVDAEKPHLRYQTSAVSAHLAKLVKVDPTGDAMVQAQLGRFFGAKKD